MQQFKSISGPRQTQQLLLPRRRFLQPRHAPQMRSNLLWLKAVHTKPGSPTAFGTGSCGCDRDGTASLASCCYLWPHTHTVHTCTDSLLVDGPSLVLGRWWPRPFFPSRQRAVLTVFTPTISQRQKKEFHGNPRHPNLQSIQNRWNGWQNSTARSIWDINTVLPKAVPGMKRGKLTLLPFLHSKCCSPSSPKKLTSNRTFRRVLAIPWW